MIYLCIYEKNENMPHNPIWDIYNVFVYCIILYLCVVNKHTTIQLQNHINQNSPHHIAADFFLLLYFLLHVCARLNDCASTITKYRAITEIRITTKCELGEVYDLLTKQYQIFQPSDI